MYFEVEHLSDSAEKVYAVQDIVSGLMYEVADRSLGERALVYGGVEAQHIARRLNVWGAIKEALDNQADVTVDDIRQIMGMRRIEV